ncbi:hypothetical protein BGW38_000986 [Lunasporangiospora selenospora]|uniref:Uncharacterized protein n=1 Tax=Lunasporangiospora selenospora TaxID=979761 RepID=A0A9P6G332_9FUNG|nr:hypothetical protein BGW38_000986 [Lunasporangiospora selenospora]
MATFAACQDLHRHPSTRNAGLAAISFCAKDNVDDELHGVPPVTSQIFGQCQFLKSLSHPSLCEYLDAIKGKRDRIFLVQEHYNNSLALVRMAQDSEDKGAALKGPHISKIRLWASQLVDGLEYLNTNGIAHRALSGSNILLNEDDHIKLFNYGLYTMTRGGSLVEFSVGDPHYLSPITLGLDPMSHNDYSADLWSVGVILTELFLRESFWRKDNLDLEELMGSLFAIRKLSIGAQNWIEACDEASIGINPEVLRFLRTGTRESDGTWDTPEEVKELASFLRTCLDVDGSNSKEAEELKDHTFLKNVKIEQNGAKGNDQQDQHSPIQKPIIQSSYLVNYEGEVDRLRERIAQGNLSTNSDGSDNGGHPEVRHKMLAKLPLPQVFYLWKLAGGDVEAQFRRDGRLVGTPAIRLLPKSVQVAGTSINTIVEDGREDRIAPSYVRDIADLFSDKPCILALDNLEAEILKSINEPNKDQFSWDTYYFLMSDPDELNFLVNTTWDEKDNGSAGSFLYPDAMQSPSGLLSSTAAKYIPHLSSDSPATAAAASGSPSKSGSGSGTTIPSLSQQSSKSRVRVPLATREKDLGYQYQRLSMFTDLLLQYPTSRAEITHHSKIDIPPVLRGKVWAAILGVIGDYQTVYDGYDKYTEKPTDRQIELDVPRCHQYNQLMFSPAGHEKMKRLLKCWVEANEDQVYWQGLDSCCAPFLTLNFNDEALALGCVQLFLPKFLRDMFLHDNSSVIHEYLAVFRHLLSFHDPELSSHLDHIRFIPQLYAISWFMTLFTHIFPLDKIYHLWDKILVGPGSLPLFVGIAILQQFRTELLRSEFNEAIGIFSGSFPEMDIEKCIESALAMCRVTPPSTCWLSYDPECRKAIVSSRKHRSTAGEGDVPGAADAGLIDATESDEQDLEKRMSTSSTNLNWAEAVVNRDEEKGEASPEPELYWWEEPLPIDVLNVELAPRIHRSEFVRMRQQAFVIDIRPEPDFRSGHYPLSIHMLVNQLDSLVHILKKLKKNYLVIIANKGDSGPEFASALVREGFPRVAVLMGGMDSLRIPELAPVLSSSNNNTGGNAANGNSNGSATPASGANTPSMTTTAASSTVVQPTVCTCRAIRQVISTPNRNKDEVVVFKCKTPFISKRALQVRRGNAE